MTTKHPEFVGVLNYYTIARPEFLSVLRRVAFSLRTLINGNFPSLNFKPLQVKCFESILKGQDVFGVSPTGFGRVDAISRLYRSRHDKEKLKLLLQKQLRTKPARQRMTFAWRTETMALPDHKVAITKQSKHRFRIQKLRPPVKRLVLSLEKD